MTKQETKVESQKADARSLTSSEGVSETFLGEVQNAVYNILHRWFNDGDRIEEGRGKETCTGSYHWLIDNEELITSSVFGGVIMNYVTRLGEDLTVQQYHNCCEVLDDVISKISNTFIDNLPESLMEWVNRPNSECSKDYRREDYNYTNVVNE